MKELGQSVRRKKCLKEKMGGNIWPKKPLKISHGTNHGKSSIVIRFKDTRKNYLAEQKSYFPKTN
mgnify:CR=1